MTCECQFMFFDGRVCGNPITRELHIDEETVHEVLWLRGSQEWWLCKGHYQRVKKHIRLAKETMFSP